MVGGFYCSRASRSSIVGGPILVESVGRLGCRGVHSVHYHDYGSITEVWRRCSCVAGVVGAGGASRGSCLTDLDRCSREGAGHLTPRDPMHT